MTTLMNHTRTAFALAFAFLLLSGAPIVQAQDADTHTCPMKTAAAAEACPLHGTDACPMKTAGEECPMKQQRAEATSDAEATSISAELVHSHATHDDVQRARVAVTGSGYAPAAITLQAGVPAEIVFTRTTGSGCAAEVHIPELGVEKTALPKDEAVTVSFTPEEPGTYAFLCGMNMLRGEIAVQ